MVSRLTTSSALAGRSVPGAPDNASVCRRVAELVVTDCLGLRGDDAKVRIEPLTINYFSMVFGIEVPGRPGGGLFVKIPKNDLRRVLRPCILPLSETDRRLAEEEYRSLCHLSTAWNAEDVGVGFVRPVAFLRQYNAIVTERVRAADGYAVFRQWDLSAKLGSGRARRRLRAVLERLGTALCRFHLKSIRTSRFDVAAEVRKINYYCECLTAEGTEPKFLRALRAELLALSGYETSVGLTQTLKGIDVRNVFVDEYDGIRLLDPGKLKENYPEADLARFLVTWRILYWGSPWFAFGIRPSDTYEDAFLRGYYQQAQRPACLLAVLLVKELLKHWFTAHDSLKLKPWARAVKHAVAAAYIDPFYKRQLIRESANALRGLRDEDTLRLSH